MLVTDGPTDMRFLFITPERFVIALCADMQLRWCDQGDPATWTPAIDNVAGVRTITQGTKLIAGGPLAGTVSMFWSDHSAYLLQYTGSEFIFDSRAAGQNCGLLSPNGFVVVGGIAYWISNYDFFLYAGSVRSIPNAEEIHNYVFDVLAQKGGYLCFAAYSPRFNEIWFCFTNSSGLNPSLYAIVGLDGYSWAVGTMERLSSTYFTDGETRPYYADADGHLHIHEEGHDDNGEPMESYITMAPAGLEKGKQNMDLEGIEPDIFEQSGEIELTGLPWDPIRNLANGSRHVTRRSRRRWPIDLVCRPVAGSHRTTRPGHFGSSATLVGTTGRQPFLEPHPVGGLRLRRTISLLNRPA